MWNKVQDMDRSLGSDQAARKKVEDIRRECVDDPNEHYDPITVLWLVGMYDSAQSALESAWEYMSEAGLCIECGGKDCDCGRYERGCC